MGDRLLALGLDRAKCDADRAIVLGAIRRFAESIADASLIAEVQALMPAAHPFVPPEAWTQKYAAGFQAYADEDCGTYVDDMERYCTEYWQGHLTDIERQARLENPSMGLEDGRIDAVSLNAA